MLPLKRQKSTTSAPCAPNEPHTRLVYAAADIRNPAAVRCFSFGVSFLSFILRVYDYMREAFSVALRLSYEVVFFFTFSFFFIFSIFFRFFIFFSFFFFFIFLPFLIFLMFLNFFFFIFFPLPIFFPRFSFLPFFFAFFFWVWKYREFWACRRWRGEQALSPRFALRPSRLRVSALPGNDPSRASSLRFAPFVRGMPPQIPRAAPSSLCGATVPGSDALISFGKKRKTKDGLKEDAPKTCRRSFVALARLFREGRRGHHRRQAAERVPRGNEPRKKEKRGRGSGAALPQYIVPCRAEANTIYCFFGGEFSGLLPGISRTIFCFHLCQSFRGFVCMRWI